VSAARLSRVNQPKISALANCRLEGLWVERLMHFLNALDRNVAKQADISIELTMETFLKSLDKYSKNCKSYCQQPVTFSMLPQS
jgi:Helix-turn-helix domain